MEWIKLEDRYPEPGQIVIMKYDCLIWQGYIWQACPQLDPVDSPMPEYWRPVWPERLNEKTPKGDATV